MASWLGSGRGPARRLRVVVCGAGPAGMTLALALAREGHAVTLLERDETPVPAQVDAAAAWKRTGVAQLHQPHAFLARGCSELLTALPDVVAALRGAGAVDVALPDGLSSFLCRRSTFEWVLRRLVEAEPRVSIHIGTARAIEVFGGAVNGVRLDDGGLHSADLVVDCGGRRSALTAAMLAQETFDEPANEVYRSRRYLLRSGRAPGPVNRGVIGVEEGDGYSFLVFPQDAGTFTVTFVHLPEDSALAGLRTVPVFDAAVRVVPFGAAWTDPAVAEPISDIMVMNGLRNVFRPLGPATPPGVHAIGDVVCSTNPHFGRGTSLAVAHALTLARAVAENPADPELWRERVDAWVHDELRSWFDDARSLDRSRSVVWRAAVNETVSDIPAIPAMSPPSPAAMPRFMVLAAAAADPVVARAVFRHMHLVDAPEDLRAVEPRVAELLASGWRPTRPADLPTRAELVDVVSAVRVPAL
ncbi:NAD(P)/FAD-dependent oxidoreductase [Frankia sp. Cr1]|uniref:NAD(P)/FAD-dependent oxidoreductase n=1 Tax=Frankia sp. Cr1 TaxID=3073931 RepID=UPI002AD40FC3|nr:FAD-dependent oxidoreductase [Frankia sp. Cr1]